MKTEKQKLLIEYLLSSPDIFTLTNTITDHKYFEPEFRNTIKFIKDYFEKYQALPDLAQLHAETGITYEIHSMTKDKIEYCVYEVESFCKEKAIFHAILDSADLLDKGKPGEIEKLIKDALTTGVYRSVGTDFFEDPASMLAQIVQDEPVSTGYKLLDQYLGGGVRRKEFILLAAQSGGGKSVVKANLGLNLLQQGLNVLYISLELPVPMVYKRYASMMTGIGQKEIENNREEVVVRINSAKKDMGQLYIEQMPIGTTTNQLRAFLKEFELKRKCIPDVLVIDYLDLMGTNQGISAENIFQKEKVAAEEIRQLIIDYNMVLIASSQLNRCLDLNTEVITPNGNKLIKDVVVGDKLFNGSVYNNVTEVLPVTKQKVYKITTKSGKTIICSGNHKFPLIDGTLGTINDRKIEIGTKLGEVCKN